MLICVVLVSYSFQVVRMVSLLNWELWTTWKTTTSSIKSWSFESKDKLLFLIISTISKTTWIAFVTNLLVAFHIGVTLSDNCGQIVSQDGTFFFCSQVYPTWQIYCLPYKQTRLEIPSMAVITGKNPTVLFTFEKQCDIPNSNECNVAKKKEKKMYFHKWSHFIWIIKKCEQFS
jgi:hypothetical protein